MREFTHGFDPIGRQNGHRLARGPPFSYKTHMPACASREVRGEFLSRISDKRPEV